MPYAVPTDEMQSSRAVTVAAAAEMLSCDPSMVRKMLRRGDLEGHRLGKRGVRVLAESIAAYQRRNSLVATAAPEEKRQNASPSHKAAMARLRALGVV